MRKKLSRDVGRVLRGSIAVDAAIVPHRLLIRSIEFVDRHELAAGAHFHGISGYVARRLRSLGRDVTRQVAGVLGRGREQAISSHLRAVADLREAGRVLDEAGLEWLVFKGPALVASVHGRADLRTYSDLDLLVQPQQLRGAVEAFEAAGFEILDRNWLLLRQQLRGELHARLPHGTVVDLHWSLINDRSCRDAFNLSTSAMLARAERLKVDVRTVRTLDPIDTLLHLAMHTVLSGGHRLLWFKDVERVLAVREVDWDGVTSRAEQIRLGPILALTLQATRRLLGAPVPEDVIAALMGSRTWQHAAALAYRVAPPQRSFGYGSVARMVSRSTRPTLGASVQELGRRWTGWARHGGRPGPRDGTLLDADNPGSMSFPSEDEADRTAFFEAVAREH